MFRLFWHSAIAISVATLAVEHFRIEIGPVELPVICFLVLSALIFILSGAAQRIFRIQKIISRHDYKAIFVSFVLMLILFLFDLIRLNADLGVAQAIIKLSFGMVVFWFFSTIVIDRALVISIATASCLLIGYVIYNSYFVLGAPYLVNSFVEITQAGRNQIGLYLAAITTTMFYLAASTSAPRSTSIFYWSVFSIHFFAMVYTTSRGAWVSFILSLAPLLFSLRVKTIAPVFVISLGALYSAALMSWDSGEGPANDLAEGVATRLWSIFSGLDPAGQGSIALREELISLAAADFWENPIFGIGNGEFVKRHEYVTHNTYLQFLVENGAAGLYIFLIPLWQVLKRMARLLRTSNSGTVNHKLAFVMGAIALLLDSLFINLLGAPIYYVFIGLAVNDSVTPPRRINRNNPLKS